MAGGLLHIYGQLWWHNDAHIVGTRDALTDLRDAITNVLRYEVPRQVEVFVNDGEGYGVWVVMLSEKEMQRMAVPYSNGAAAETDESAVNPGSLVHREGG